MQHDEKINLRKNTAHVFAGAPDSIRVTNDADEITVVQKQAVVAVSQKHATQTIKKVRNGQ